MDYRTFRYILAVVEERNISKAAARLHISQPSLSHCILKQEKDLGVSLFDRSRQPLRLTYAGERYVRAARQILAVKNQLEDDMRSIASHRSGRVSIGVTKLRSSYLLPRILPRFMELNPNVEIDLSEENASDLEGLLQSGDIEVAILLSPARSDHFAYRYLFAEDIVLCMPREHPLVGEFRKNGLDLGMLSEEPFILYKNGQRVRMASDIFCGNNGFEPKVLIESQFAETILGLVASGMGCAFVPQSVLMYSGINPKPAYFTLHDPAVMSDFVLAWRKNAKLSWAASEFISVTQDVLKSIG